MKTCPTCGAELVEADATCGDNDPQCDCDVYYDCPGCGGEFVDPCGAHPGGWRHRQELTP